MYTPQKAMPFGPNTYDFDDGNLSDLYKDFHPFSSTGSQRSVTNLQSPNHEQAPISTGNLDFGAENAFGFLPSQLSHMSDTHSPHSSSPTFPGNFY